MGHRSILRILSSFLAAALLLRSPCCALLPATSIAPHSKKIAVSHQSSSADVSTPNQRQYNKIYLDIAVTTQSNDKLNVGRLWFNLTPTNHPHYLPLHISNLCNLAESKRKAVDPKATYVGCTFQFSPATIDDGSFRYRWGHQCDGYGRNGIQASLASGRVTDWDEPFSDPERIKECTHESFGGSYYGWNYSEILEILSEEDTDENAAILLTVPISGPGFGTSKFSIVRVSESPREWGERLLQNSAVIGFLDCSANGGFSEDTNDGRSSLQVLRAMAKQNIGVPTIVACGAEMDETI